jgi:hypothetical protein
LHPYFRGSSSWLAAPFSVGFRVPVKDHAFRGSGGKTDITDKEGDAVRAVQAVPYQLASYFGLPPRETVTGSPEKEGSGSPFER